MIATLYSKYSKLLATSFSTSGFSRRRFALALLLAAAFAAGSAAQTATTAAADKTETQHSADAESRSAKAEGSTEESGEEAENTAGAESGSEEDYEWLKDEQGRTYRVATIPKVERTYSRPQEGWVRFPGGATFLTVKESDDTFWVKVFERSQFERAPRTRPTPSPEELAQIETRFDYELEEVDRVSLEPFDAGLPKKGQWRDGFDLADMNGDGHIDIVFGPPRKSHSFPLIFLGDGAGTWRRWKEASFENTAYDYGDVIASDWNGDGHMDLAFGVHLRGILALVGDGKGKFTLASQGIDFDIPGSKTPLAAYSSKALAAFDWNQDGRIDIVAQGEGPKRVTGNAKEVVQGSVGIRVFINQTDGSWQALHVSPMDDRNFADDFALLDIDGDGRKDIVTATHQLGNSWLVLRRSSPLGAQLEQLEELPERGVVDSVTVGDFDADGREDLLLSYRANVLGKWRAGIDLLLYREDGWQRHTVLSLLQRQPFRALAVGDLDGDEHLDFAALDDFGILRLLLGRGDGRFDSDLTLEGPKARLGCQGYDIALQDLDGDGGSEIVAAFAGEPQGIAAFTGSNVSGCEGGGSLRAWKVNPVKVAESG